MKKVRLLLSAAAATALAFSAQAGAPLYETGFETNGDASGASYSLGVLDGQGAVGSFSGWQVSPAGSASVVVSDGALSPHSGDNFVHQSAGSEITASLADASPRMLVRAWHNGAGATVPTNPTPGVDAAAVLAFEAVDGSTYTVNAWNGTSSQFETPSPAVNLANDSWHSILLGVNYGAKVYHLSVNGAPYLNTLGFFNNTVSQFNGFRASTTVGANIDTIGFFPSNGDYDGDGLSDDIEMTTTGGDPLNASVFPGFGDVNGDNFINLLDALLHFRVMSTLIPAGGLNVSDNINGVGGVDLADSATLYAFVVGDPDVPVIPPVN